MAAVNKDVNYRELSLASGISVLLTEGRVVALTILPKYAFPWSLFPR